MKNKLTKIFALVCALALAMSAICVLTACGENGIKYTYSGTDVEGVGSAAGTTMVDSMKTMYDSMYKGSTVTLKNDKLILQLADEKSEMSVKKEGEKYILGGEYVDQMKNALSAGSSVGGATATVEFDMYGVETDSGFNIVMSSSSTVSLGGISSTAGYILTIKYVK